MIPAQELRTGNWILVEGKACRVSRIDESGCGTTTKGFVAYAEAQPVPITDALLLQTGFIKDAYGYRSPLLALNQYESVYYLRIPPGTGFGRAIRYVHQLQNLYYEITGQDYQVAEGHFV